MYSLSFSISEICKIFVRQQVVKHLLQLRIRKLEGRLYQPFRHKRPVCCLSKLFSAFGH